MTFPPQTNNPFYNTQLSHPEDFLSPEQRLDAIAEILAAIGLRAMKESSIEASDKIDHA